jgi:hypothetical protein
MIRKWTFVCLMVVVGLLVTQGAWAKEQYVYSVKFVCGYNPTNLGVSLSGSSEGEPSVKFGNYATEINIFWPELYLFDQTNFVFKHIVLFVDKGVPVGREPKVAEAKQYIDAIQLKQMTGTMDDCNRIAELLWGAAPTPYPLTIGYLVLTSTHELDVTAVYTAQACSNWVNTGISHDPLPCLDASGKQQGVSISESVERIPSRKLLLSSTAATADPAGGTGAKK